MVHFENMSSFMENSNAFEFTANHEFLAGARFNVRWPIS